MNEWNLNALYTSFQDKNFQEDLNTLKDLNKNYFAYRNEKTRSEEHTSELQSHSEISRMPSSA